MKLITLRNIFTNSASVKNVHSLIISLTENVVIADQIN